MTEQEAVELRKKLEEHYGCRVVPAKEYCTQFYTFLDIAEDRIKEYLNEESIRNLRYYVVGKSCLLDRMIYGGEKPSTVPCPVHNGKWAGIHGPWPDSSWVDSDGNKTPATTSQQCQKWYDEGCRCYKHSCGCTTGWQPENTDG